MFIRLRAVRGGAAGAARAAPLFVEKFVIIARIHSLLSGATPDLAMIEACAWPRVCTGSNMVAERGIPKRAPDTRYPKLVGRYPKLVGRYPKLVGR